MCEIPEAKGKLIDAAKYGVTADDDMDDSKALQQVLTAAHEIRGHVILGLPKGIIIVSEIIKIKRSNIVLRGAGSGPDGTNLHFPRPLQMIVKTDLLDELREYLKNMISARKRKIEISMSCFQNTPGAAALSGSKKTGRAQPLI